MDYPFQGHGPLYLLLLFFLAGVFLGLAAGPPWGAPAALVLLFCLLLLFHRRLPFAAAASVAVLCGLLTAGRVPLADPGQVGRFLDNEVVFRGVIEETKPNDSGWSGVASGAVVSTLDGSAKVRLGRVLLSVRTPDAYDPSRTGVRATGRLHPFTSRGNPGEIPREWSAMSKGVQYVFSTDASRSVFLPPEDGDGGLSGVFRRARERTSRWMERHAGRTDGALYLRSLTTGEVPPASHPMVALLRKTGLAHLLAISGINVVIFFAVHSFLARCGLWAIRRWKGTPDLNRAAALLSIPVCWAYVLMAGAPVPAVRSAGMITLAVILWNVRGIRKADLAWTVLFSLTLIASPFQVVSPSFLLSYLASFFLIASFASRPAIAGKRAAARRVWEWGKDALVASAVAFLGTLPVSAAFFGHLPAGAILWNLVFGPVLGTAGVLGAFLAAVGGSFSFDFLGVPVRLASQGLTAALSLLARISGDGWGYVPLPPSGVAAPLFCTWAAVWGAVALRRRGKAPWPAALTAALAFLLWVHLPYAALPDDRLTVAAINVGKGAAHVVSFPGGRHMVIDCGSALRGDAGNNVVAPFLRGRGIRRVDVLVLTHPHEDHYGGAEVLLEQFPVAEIWIPAGVPPSAFGEAVSRRASIVRPKYGGEVFSAGGAQVIVRGTGASGEAAGANERSLLLEARYGSLSVWLPGDVEKGPAAWGRAAGNGGGNRGGKRILFLPHHGSPGADPASWVRVARPFAVVSQNRNCFPEKNLLPSFESFLLENGMFAIRSDGDAVSCKQEGVFWVWKLLWRLP